MPAWKDAITIALAMPGTEVSTFYGTPGLKVGGKGFARLRSEAEGGLVVFCDLDAKAELLESGDPAFFTTPHYDGYGAIIIDLKKIDTGRLGALLRESWRMKASPKIRKAHDASAAASGSATKPRAPSPRRTRTPSRSRRS